MSFFKKFPSIFYNGHQCKNLLARAKLTDETKNNFSLYYPYTIKEVDGRPEMLADAYYDDPYAVWMIYFANEVVDPYYDLGLSDKDFQAHITKKYGSVANAQSQVAFYRTNWELIEESSITPAAYDLLTADEKYYWEPVLNVYGSLTSYRRKKEDQIINTNRMFQLTIETEGEFIPKERVEANSSIFAYVVDSNSSSVIVQHVTGVNTTNIVDMTIVGNWSNTSATVTESILLCENISANVQTNYWMAVSQYDNEVEVNTLRRNINMLDARYKNKIEDELKEVMKK